VEDLAEVVAKSRQLGAEYSRFSSSPWVGRESNLTGERLLCVLLSIAGFALNAKQLLNENKIDLFIWIFSAPEVHDLDL
jgi:hypothetical protein